MNVERGEKKNGFQTNCVQQERNEMRNKRHRIHTTQNKRIKQLKMCLPREEQSN